MNASSGMRSSSVVMRCVGESSWSSIHRSQKVAIWVRSLPFPGIGLGRTTSKAEMRSEATMSILAGVWLSSWSVLGGNV